MSTFNISMAPTGSEASSPAPINESPRVPGGSLGLRVVYSRLGRGQTRHGHAEW